MRNLGWLLFGFSGRIGRKPWLIAAPLVFASLFAMAHVIGHGMAWLAPEDADFERVLQIGLNVTLAYTAIALISLTALTVKRSHDRNWPPWFGYLAFVPYLLLQSIPSLGYDLGALLAWTPILVVVSLYLVFLVFVIIDSALMKGTAGPNRYGPDPLVSDNHG